MSEINILIPSAGFASRDLLEHIAYHEKGKYRLVLSDMNPEINTKTVASKFYKSPATVDEDYLPFIIDVCQKENIHIIIPGKSSDAKFFAKYDALFREKGIAIILSPPKTIMDVTDKYKVVSILQEYGLKLSNSLEVKTIKEFEEAVECFGYPGKPICIKPSKYPEGSGRGFRIIDSSKNIHKRLFWEPTSELYYVSIDQVITAMKHEIDFPPLLVMEYYPGEEYSVYCFCDSGKPIYIVPNRRIRLYQMSTLEAVVDLNQEIISLTKEICNVFNFEYIINIQLKYDLNNKPQLIEINPRLAGTVMLPVRAGVDMIHYSIQKALGENFEKHAKIVEGYRIIRELTSFYYES